MRTCSLLQLVACMLFAVGFLPSAVGDERPNVLFLAVDDMKDWVNCLGGYEGVVHTPNIDRLAKQGVLFANAHCASPKCAPSRAAIMTGLRPSTTGLYDNGHWWYPNYPDVVTIPTHLRAHGYRVSGGGKIFHHTAGNNPSNQWDDIGEKRDLAGVETKREAKLHPRLRAWRAEVGADPMRPNPEDHLGQE